MRNTSIIYILFAFVILVFFAFFCILLCQTHFCTRLYECTNSGNVKMPSSLESMRENSCSTNLAQVGGDADGDARDDAADDDDDVHGSAHRQSHIVKD